MLSSAARDRSPYTFLMSIDPRRVEVIDERTAEIVRRMTPQERVVRGLEMGEFARQIILARVREEHPDWDEARAWREVIRRFAA